MAACDGTGAIEAWAAIDDRLIGLCGGEGVSDGWGRTSTSKSGGRASMCYVLGVRK